MTKVEFANWLESSDFTYQGETEDNRTFYKGRAGSLWDVFISSNGDVEISSGAFPRAFHGNVNQSGALIRFLTS